MGLICTWCRTRFDFGMRAVLIQEDADLRAAQQQDDEGSWDWLPMGINGMHYALLHYGCWKEVFDTLASSDRSAGFMFYIGNVDLLGEVVTSWS